MLNPLRSVGMVVAIPSVQVQLRQANMDKARDEEAFGDTAQVELVPLPLLNHFSTMRYTHSAILALY